MDKESEIIIDAYELLNKIYQRLLDIHARSNKIEDLNLIKEIQLFELKHGIAIEQLKK